MYEHPVNALADASSSYLRSAMRQPVQWLPWGPEAFAQAAAEDKPVLLDIGAVWCHWCHVMDRESYEDVSTAELINTHFIAVKVDRDERPDVDTRYQAAVAAISGQGGWPLTVFLTPDGKPYFGGTYFPPEERYGQPGFQRVLRMMAHSFYERRDEVVESAGSVMEAIEQSESFTGPPSDLQQPTAAAQIADRMVAATLQQFDPVHGGFGSQPKFPNAAALDMLLDAAGRPGPDAEAARNAALKTLHAMSRGGIFDQLAGGFHRYSVDSRWVVPHFEKMLYDNAALLGTYVRAVQALGDAECAATAAALLRWMDEHLSDRERGGFYTSQDADVSPGDDGSYFTWSRAEAAAVLLPEELRFAEVYFDLGAVGDMQHDPSRNVLFRAHPLHAAAQRAGLDAAVAESVLASVTAKLQAARKMRQAPFIDRTMYTAWNGMAISAYALAGRVLEQPEPLDFARKSLDRILRDAMQDGAVAHVVAYGEGPLPATTVPGVLDDHVLLAHACLDVWEATGEARYVRSAEGIAQVLLTNFYDDEGGGFFDTARGGQTLGALAARRKPVQDAPTPAGNPAAAALLLRLHALTSDERYRNAARRTLECFAGVVEHLGLYAATFGLALRRWAGPAVQVVIVGDGAEADALESAALAGYAVNRSVIRLSPAQVHDLPAALAETVPQLPQLESAVALVCSGNTCMPPVTDVAGLRMALERASTVQPSTYHNSSF